jgi:hypothetical protein
MYGRLRDDYILMAHYALLDSNNLVVNVITGRHEGEEVDGITDWEKFYGDLHGQTCKRTSYNTFGNQHLDGGTPFRGNYAGIGFTYDEGRDVFIPPQPFPSWVLNETSFLWDAPVPYPDDGLDYVWDEDTVSWVQIDVGD